MLSGANVSKSTAGILLVLRSIPRVFLKSDSEPKAVEADLLPPGERLAEPKTPLSKNYDLSGFSLDDSGRNLVENVTVTEAVFDISHLTLNELGQ